MNPASKHSSSNITEYIGDISVKSKASASNFSQFVDIESKASVGNMTEYIGDISARDTEVRDNTVGDTDSRENESKTQSDKKDDGNWFRGLTKSFEEEGLLGLSFGIVNAVTSTAMNVVTGTASNVGHMLTNHEHNNERRIVKDRYAPENSRQKSGPAVFQFASYIADIVLSTVSPVLDLHFFGYAPNPKADMQLSVYWDSPSVKKSIGYGDNVSFHGTESVYFDTRSVGFFSAITGDERSVAESIMSDDFYSAVSREEAEELEIEFV